MKTRMGTRVGLMMAAGLCLACQLVSPGEGGFKLPSGLKPPSLPIEPRVGDGDGDGPQVSLPDEPLPLPPFDPGTGPGTGPGGSGPPRPWLRASFYAGVSPQGLAVGDFNEDGALDVVINAGGRDFQSAHVARAGEFLLLRNNGKGRLERVSAPSPHKGSGRIVVGDVDRDDHLDVLLGTHQGMRLLRGLGTGVLLEQSLPGESGRGAVSDVFLWPSPSGRAVSLGSISHARSPRPGIAGVSLTEIAQNGAWASRPWTLDDAAASPVLDPTDEDTLGVVADFNEDDRPDLALSKVQSGSRILQTLLRTHNGELAPGASLSHLPALNRLYAADIDGDGHVDVLGLRDDSLLVLGGNGNGEFQLRALISLGAATQDIAVVDYDRDGSLDVVALHSASAEVSLLAGHNGALVPHARMSVGRAPTAAVVADLDRDGQFELLITEADDNAVSVYVVPPRPSPPLVLGPAGAGAAACPLRMPVSGPVAAKELPPLARLRVGYHDAPLLAAGDFDGDGVRDLALTRQDFILLLLNRKDGSFATLSIQDTVGVTGLSAGDFDGDGRTDLAAASFGNMQVLWNDESALFKSRLVIQQVRSPLAGDFNSDGRVDLAATVLSDCTGGVRRFTNVGSRAFRMDALKDYNVDPSGECLKASGAVAGDYNGDGRPDLIHLSRGINLNPTEINGTTLPGHGFELDTPSDARLWSADATGDGKVDLLVRSPAAPSRLLLYPGDGHGSLRAPFSCSLSLPGTVLVWEDMNGDGLLDVLGVGEDGSSVWMRAGRGQGQWTEPRAYAMDGLVQQLFAVDLLGDARPELAVVTRAGTLSVFSLP